MPKETRAYNKLKAMHMDAHWQRIETWTTPGIFDSNSCRDGREIWVECKQASKPKREGSKVNVEVKQAQIVWEAQRRQAGGKTFVALMVGPVLYVLHGRMLYHLKEGMTLAEIERYKIPPLEIFELKTFKNERYYY